MPTQTGSNEQEPLVEDIRRAVRQHVGATSLRSVARQLGSSPSGLSKFMAGARPYKKRFLRLKAWYARHRGEPVHLEEGDAAAALTLLTAGMEEQRRALAVKKIVDALEEGFAANRPDWLDALRA